MRLCPAKPYPTGDLVTLEKDTAGQVTVLAANTAQLNALRTEILGRILEQVE